MHRLCSRADRPGSTAVLSGLGLAIATRTAPALQSDPRRASGCQPDARPEAAGAGSSRVAVLRSHHRRYARLPTATRSAGYRRPGLRGLSRGMNNGGSLPAAYFDALYTKEKDPWRFASSPYEQAKYAATLQALPVARFTDALEIGCSIGVLTR